MYEDIWIVLVFTKVFTYEAVEIVSYKAAIRKIMHNQCCNHIYLTTNSRYTKTRFRSGHIEDNSQFKSHFFVDSRYL